MEYFLIRINVDITGAFFFFQGEKDGIKDRQKFLNNRIKVPHWNPFILTKDEKQKVYSVVLKSVI